MSAQQMREHPSFPEQKLWRAIHAGKVGACVRRQFVVGRYVADFAIPSRKLLIEVDGPHHSRQRSADARRDRHLAKLGWRVLRVSAADVLYRLEEVVERVRGAVG